MSTRSGFKSLAAASLVTLVGLLVLPVMPAEAQEQTRQQTGEDLVRTELLADVGAIAPGSRFYLAVRYQIAPEWHIYWVNPGESGMSPSITIKAPEGFEVGEILWPRPKVFRSSDLTYGYEKEVFLIVPLTAPELIESAEVTIEAELDWFVCRKICLIGSREQSLVLPVTHAGRRVPADSRIVDTWARRMPVPMKRIPSASARVTDGTLRLDGPAGASGTALFYPGRMPGITLVDGPGPIKGVIADGRYSFAIPLEIEPGNALGKQLKVSGIVALGPDSGARAINIDVPLQPAGGSTID